MAEPAIDKREVARAFGRAAASYDAHAVLQREVMSRLGERLEWMNIRPGRIADAGCGTGQGLRLLQARYPDAEIVGLDLAFSMVKMARHASMPDSWLGRFFQRLTPHSSRLAHYVCADIERLPFCKSSIDLVWSSLALQWVGDAEAAFRELHRVIAPQGLLLFSTFGPDTLKELRRAFADVDGGSHVSRFLDMHDIGDMLVHAGFQHPVMEMEILTLTYADLKSLMRDLKGIGAHNAAADRARGMMGKHAWRKLEQAYEVFRKDGRLPATYEVIYGHAWAGDKTRLEDGRQIIRFNIQQRKAGMR
ncbi:MAG: malonyl-ACP O-methyltransferase BioC [Pseudomonadota bacterium]